MAAIKIFLSQTRRHCFITRPSTNFSLTHIHKSLYSSESESQSPPNPSPDSQSPSNPAADLQTPEASRNPQPIILQTISYPVKPKPEPEPTQQAQPNSNPDPQFRSSERVISQTNTKCKFDETLEAHVKMTPDLRRTDLKLNGTASLPHGTGKPVRIAVFAEGGAADEARAAGADVVGGEDLIEGIKTDKPVYDKWIVILEFDGHVLERDMLGAFVRTAARVLKISKAEAKAKIYKMETKMYYGFHVYASEEMAKVFSQESGVGQVLPDSF